MADQDNIDDGRYVDRHDWIECWQCSGEGRMPGCFEDCCSGTDCDPDDPDFCCAPSRCDVCGGKGGWTPPAEASTPSSANRHSEEA